MWLLSLLFTSSGFLIGGIIVRFFKGLQQKVEIIYGICAGIILGLISFEFFPESIEVGGWIITLVGFILGIMVFEVLHKGLHYHQEEKSISEKKMHIHTGLLLMVSFSIHNLPMGIILGSSQKSDLTIALLQTLLFHSIPEGIILFTPLLLAGTNLIMGLFISVIISIPVSLGVFLGGFLGFSHPILITILFSFTIGIIFMVTVSEILYPALIKSSLFKVSFFTLIGLGIIVLYLKIV